MVLFGAFGLAACGSSSVATTTTASSTTTTATSGTLPATSVSETDIKHAYTTLFDLANPAIPPKLAVVQDGSSLRGAFTKAIKSPLAAEAAGASVSSIKLEQGAACSKAFLPSPCAAVVYDVLGPNHKPVLTGSSGGAVYLSNQWLVSKNTICTLLNFVSISC
jgi:hypothetical protein